MRKVLTLMQELEFQCLPCDRVNLDLDRYSEYLDSDEHPADMPFENPPLKANKREIRHLDREIDSLLTYFLDGSRRTYKIADLVKDGRYLPIVAGQIGVAVVARNSDGEIEPLRNEHYVMAMDSRTETSGEVRTVKLVARRHFCNFLLTSVS